MERLQASPTLTEVYDRLLTLEPKPVANSVPANGDEQRAAFLSGEQYNPDHIYAKLNTIDFAARYGEIDDVSNLLLNHSSMNDKHAVAYSEFVDSFKKRLHFMELTRDYKMATDLDEKQRVRSEYMALNKELYGEPDEVTYRSLLNEKITIIRNAEITGRAVQIRNELLGMLTLDEATSRPERFTPSDETIEWMHGVAENLYASMLSHVPEDKGSYTAEEAKTVFESILHEEFGDAAEGWRVEIRPSQAIKVEAPDKCIVIPSNRADISKDQLRQLIVHEIGVHVLRAIMGENTDLAPLKSGLAGYRDSEEGLGVVMEQALKSKFTEAGVGHYITAGLAHIDGFDFRKTFEAKWRMAVIEDLKPGEELDDAAIQKAREIAYKRTMRIFRGTDELPWFKDLSYYNGSANMWRHLEEIRGDDLMFTFILLGKADPTNPTHLRSMRETASA